ncbi:MAG: thiamine pyrophosphate-binding protein [Pseudomonadota bacterium]|nr:thiamine pyrophosphate-binding protein [Pseudomonadota bacterium]
MDRTEAGAGKQTSTEKPTGTPPPALQYGSDVVAETLRALALPYIALVPGASFRGLHDSLVNYLGNRDPQMLLCLHEEHAVAIAHGYAKVTGKPMAVALHSNVGLFHATMAIFNAWCDRMPVLILGATGPVDAVKRRPWIDWIHTARDQGAIVRPYVKWDDQPASPEAAREALLRAMWHTRTAPQGPVYVNLDAEMQEAPLAAPLPPIAAARYTPSVASAPAVEVVREAAAILRRAKHTMFLIGRVSRDPVAWDARIALAEALNATVLTDLKVGAAFPTDHPLHANAAGILLRPEAAEAIAKADVILSLDWVDLAGTLKTACGGESSAKIIQVSLDHLLHGGWSMDYQGLPPVDLFIAAEPDAAVPMLLEALAPTQDKAPAGSDPAKAFLARKHTFSAAPSENGRLSTDDVAVALRGVVGERPTSFSHLPLSWNGASWPFRHPLDFLGSDGGGGIGAGPGIAVGAALALKGSGRLPVAVCGDGDFLMGATAIWTAVHYRIPLLIIVANNRSYYNDEVHQERVARMRDRPVENKWIGQRIADPDLDLAAIARAQGAQGWGPIEKLDALGTALEQAVRAVDDGAVAVVDVRVQGGYTPALTAALTQNRRG